MSADAIASCWGASGLTPAQRFVAIAIADVVNDAHGNQFWMRPEVLGEKVGMDPGNVRRKLCELVDAGVLEVVEPGGGRGRSTVYRWTLSEPRNSYAVQETASRTTETASKASRNRVNPANDSLYRTQGTEERAAVARDAQNARNARRLAGEEATAPDPDRLSKIRAIKQSRTKEHA